MYWDDDIRRTEGASLMPHSYCARFIDTEDEICCLSAMKLLFVPRNTVCEAARTIRPFLEENKKNAVYKTLV